MKIFNDYLCRQLKGGGMEINMNYDNLAFCCEFTRKSMEMSVLYDELVELVEYAVNHNYKLTAEAQYLYDLIHSDTNS